MRHDVIADVTSHVTSNVVTEVAHCVSDMVVERVKDKLTVEPCASIEHPKNQHTMDNRARELASSMSCFFLDKVLNVILRTVRWEVGEPVDDGPDDPTASTEFSVVVF